MNNAPRCYFVTKHQVFPHCTSTHASLTHDTNSMQHSIMCLKSQVITNTLRAKWSAPQRNFSPSKRWQFKARASRRTPRLVFFVWHKHGGPNRTAQRHSAKHVINKHLILHDTIHRHRQHTCPPEIGPPCPQSAQVPTFASQKTRKCDPRALFFF